MRKALFTIFISSVFFLNGCTEVPKKTYIEEAEIYHWYHPHVTVARFVYDHKTCLGIKEIHRKSRFSKILDPTTPYTIPKWDGLWATFESRDGREIGHRIAMSIPSNQSSQGSRTYRKCMFAKGYNLKEAYGH